MMSALSRAGKSWVNGLALSAAIMIGSPVAAQDLELGKAVVPTTIIYPGQEIDVSKIQLVSVTNPNLIGGYARAVGEVDGMISTKTLLPGRTIMVSALRQPYTVKRGDKVVLVYDDGSLRITASGTPLADALTGEMIRARNTDTGVIVSGTVMADGSVLVAQK